MIASFFLKLFRYFAGMFTPAEFTCKGGYKDIWKLAWPLIIMNGCNTVMLLCNRIILSKLQLEDVTASVASSQLFNCASCFFVITTSFTGTIVAQHFGNKNKEECVRAAWNGFYFACMVSIFLLAFLPPFGSWIFQYGSLSDAVKEREVIYFTALTPSAAFACMEAPFLTFFTATGRSRITAAAKIGTCIISVPLNYIMIFGKCGLPAMGIKGAGLAISTAAAVSFLFALTAFLVQKQDLWASRKYFHFRFATIKKLFLFGAPGGLQTNIRSAGFACVLLWFGCLGDLAMTAAGLAMTINLIAFIPLLGLMDSASVLTGKYIGERDLATAAMISKRSIRLLSLYFIFIAVLYLLFPEILIKLFSPKSGDGLKISEVLPLVKIILILQIFQNFYDGQRFITAGSLRGAGDTRIPLVLAIVSVWMIQVPMTFIFTKIFPSPIYIAWAAGITFYVVCDALIIQWRKNTGAWKRIKVVDLDSKKTSEA